MASIPFPSRELLDKLCPYQTYCGEAKLGIRTASDVYALWEAWEKESGMVCPVPHWAIVWPAARVLSSFILDNPSYIRDKRVLEIGSGSGLVSLACMKAGAAFVTSNDTDKVCLKVSVENAVNNNLYIYPENENLLLRETLPDVDVILAADFFYLKSDSGRCLDLFDKWAEAGKVVIFADGGRAFAPKRYRKILLEKKVETDEALEGRKEINVRVVQYC